MQIGENKSNRPELKARLPDVWAALDLTAEEQLQLHLTVAFRDVTVRKDAAPSGRNNGATKNKHSEVRPAEAAKNKNMTHGHQPEVRTEPRPVTRSQDVRPGRPMTRSRGLQPPANSPPPARRQRAVFQAPHASVQGESAQGESCATPPASNAGERTQEEPRAPTPDPADHQAFRSRTAKSMSRHLGILKRDPKPGEEWLLDFAVMGLETLGPNGEMYALVVMDAGSDLVYIHPTHTRSRVWEHLDEVIALWGYAPNAIRCDAAAEFIHDKLFKAWRRKHHITLRVTQPHRHKMQGKIENFIRNMKQRCRASILAFNGPMRLWPELLRMFEAVHNIMPRQVPKHAMYAGLSPYAIYKPVTLTYDVQRLWHPPGSYVVGKLAKNDPLVADTSMGARGVEGIFLGCNRTSPRVRMYVPKYRKFMEFRDVDNFDERLPFRDGMLDNTGFTAAEIASMKLPLRPAPSRASMRLPVPMPPAAANVSVDNSAPGLDDTCVDLITEVTDSTLAKFAAQRRFPIHLPALSFYDEAWDLECVGTAKCDGRACVVAKHVRCVSNPSLTAQWRSKDLELPVSRGPYQDRDVSLRRAIHLAYPHIKTMQDLVQVCKIKTPFPLSEGEKHTRKRAVIDTQQDSVQIKGRKLHAETQLVTLDDASLARVIVRHAKPLQISDTDLVEPTGVRTNKNRVTIEYRYLTPKEREVRGDVGTIPVSRRKEDENSVRDVLDCMHDFPDTLKDVGLHGKTAEVISQAHLAAWDSLLTGWKSVGPHTTAWTADRGDSGVVEEDLLQVASENPFCDQELAKRWAMLADIEKVSKEEGIDLSWIDLTEPDPRNRPQAMRNERLRPIWKSEEEIEIKGLWERGCFKRIKRSELPADARIISSRFHYKIKRTHAGEDKLKVKRLKVRLVVQGQHMSQQKGDFDNAFSPVPHLAGIRTVISIATAENWTARAVDLTQGFIQADLPKNGKPIYITPPPGVQEDSDVVYQVLRPLYGMPHSGRCLHVTWSKWLQSEGFEKVGYEGSMWAKDDGEDKILIATHVDDSLITGSNPEKIDVFIDKLKNRFAATAEVGVEEYLGMEWERDMKNSSSKLHQAAFTEKLLKDYGHWECQRPPLTPMVPKSRLSAEDQPAQPDPVLHRKYRSIVGALGWLNSGTRPDISHAYSELSKYVQRPGEKHMEAAEHCLKYLSGTYGKPDSYLSYKASADERDGQKRNRLWGWVDADFAADLETRRSHTGYLLMLNGGAVSWKSTKQKSVSLSTAESEWYAASEAGKEILYLRFILADFGFGQEGPTDLYEDSRAVICMAENPVNRKASRHMDTRKHFIGQLVTDQIVKLLPCKTDKMVADALTKSLQGPTFRQHRARMMGNNDSPYSAYLSLL